MHPTTNNNEEVARHEIIRAVRSLMPKRPLEAHEALGIAERQADRLLDLLGLDQHPVDLDAIAGLPRLNVKVVSGLPVSGFSEWSRSRWVIALRADEPIVRRRFTLAHEIKHVLDHPHAQVLYGSGRDSEKQVELICDYFAACLLMPRMWVKRQWTTGHQDVRDLATTFGVSEAAMAVRLRQLGLTEPAPRCNHLTVRPNTGAWLRRYQRALSPSFTATPAPGWAHVPLPVGEHP